MVATSRTSRRTRPRPLTNVIIESRAKLGYTQFQLARVLGVDQSTVSNWETGRRIPGGLEMLALQRLLGFGPEHVA